MDITRIDKGQNVLLEWIDDSGKKQSQLLPKAVIDKVEPKQPGDTTSIPNTPQQPEVVDLHQKVKDLDMTYRKSIDKLSAMTAKILKEKPNVPDIEPIIQTIKQTQSEITDLRKVNEQLQKMEIPDVTPLQVELEKIGLKIEELTNVMNTNVEQLHIGITESTISSDELRDYRNDITRVITMISSRCKQEIEEIRKDLDQVKSNVTLVNNKAIQTSRAIIETTNQFDERLLETNNKIDDVSEALNTYLFNIESRIENINLTYGSKIDTIMTNLSELRNIHTTELDAKDKAFKHRIRESDTKHKEQIAQINMNNNIEKHRQKVELINTKSKAHCDRIVAEASAKLETLNVKTDRLSTKKETKLQKKRFQLFMKQCQTMIKNVSALYETNSKKIIKAFKEAKEYHDHLIKMQEEVDRANKKRELEVERLRKAEEERELSERSREFKMLMRGYVTGIIQEMEQVHASLQRSEERVRKHMKQKEHSVKAREEYLKKLESGSLSNNIKGKGFGRGGIK